MQGDLAWNARESWPGMPGNPGPECPGILARSARESWRGMPQNAGFRVPTRGKGHVLQIEFGFS